MWAVAAVLSEMPESSAMVIILSFIVVSELFADYLLKVFIKALI